MRRYLLIAFLLIGFGIAAPQLPGCGPRPNNPDPNTTEVTFKNSDAILEFAPLEGSFETPLKFDAAKSLVGSNGYSVGNEGELVGEFHIAWHIATEETAFDPHPSSKGSRPTSGRVVAVRVYSSTSDSDPIIATAFYTGEPLTVYEGRGMKVTIRPADDAF